MGILEFIGALSLLELSLLVFVFALTAYGTYMDRDNRYSGVKWLGLVLFIGVYYFVNPSLRLEDLVTASFWKTVAAYVALGLCYCIPEWFFTIKNMRDRSAKDWETFLAGKVAPMEKPFILLTEDEHAFTLHRSKSTSFRDWVHKLQNEVAHGVTSDIEEKIRASNEYIRRRLSVDNNLLKLNVSLTEQALIKNDVRISAPVLAGYIGAWTLFWPWYLLSLVLGDLLSYLWEMCADFMIRMSRKFIDRAFSEVFKT